MESSCTPDSESESVVGQQRIGPEPVAQLDERYLGGQPGWILRYGVHRLDGVVANQKQAVAQHQERFKACPDSMSGKLEIAHIHFSPEQTRPQGASISQEILLKPGLARPDISQQMSFLVAQRDNRPFVEDHLLVLGVHLAGTRANQLFGLVECHINVRKQFQKEAVPGPLNKGICWMSGCGNEEEGWGRPVSKPRNFPNVSGDENVATLLKIIFQFRTS